ncbi:hypothetical protein THAOC_00209 [Thalassiosira oceanica]|uniref:Uncharacterized protein n=1 Tax=Thalassiosira oceanica TaxID=159749 RepID=K0TJR6_THAOC|nr:hypothetical protein THAOC_00209 [Thalassiosira oceanica]|eukprot:EJK77925.1 hypothetical protein THAOC_00209 [Thalassiosira oceanica]
MTNPKKSSRCPRTTNDHSTVKDPARTMALLQWRVMAATSRIVTIDMPSPRQALLPVSLPTLYLVAHRDFSVVSNLTAPLLCISDQNCFASATSTVSLSDQNYITYFTTKHSNHSNHIISTESSEADLVPHLTFRSTDGACFASATSPTFRPDVSWMPLSVSCRTIESYRTTCLGSRLVNTVYAIVHQQRKVSPSAWAEPSHATRSPSFVPADLGQPGLGTISLTPFLPYDNNAHGTQRHRNKEQGFERNSIVFHQRNSREERANSPSIEQGWTYIFTAIAAEPAYDPAAMGASNASERAREKQHERNLENRALEVGTRNFTHPELHHRDQPRGGGFAALNSGGECRASNADHTPLQTPEPKRSAVPEMKVAEAEPACRRSGPSYLLAVRTRLPQPELDGNSLRSTTVNHPALFGRCYFYRASDEEGKVKTTKTRRARRKDEINPPPEGRRPVPSPPRPGPPGSERRPRQLEVNLVLFRKVDCRISKPASGGEVCVILIVSCRRDPLSGQDATDGPGARISPPRRSDDFHGTIPPEGALVLLDSAEPSSGLRTGSGGGGGAALGARGPPALSPPGAGDHSPKPCPACRAL